MLLALPARLGHAGDVPLVGGVAQADPAEAEFAVVSTRATAAAAAVVAARLELRVARLLHLHRSLSHRSYSPRPALRPLRLRPRRRPRPRLPAWRRPRGSPLLAARVPPARLRPSGGLPLSAALVRFPFLSLRARRDRGGPPGRMASPSRAEARKPRGQF